MVTNFRPRVLGWQNAWAMMRVLDKFDMLINDSNPYKQIRFVLSGHTDKTPVSGVEYSTNYELSGSRALQVQVALDDSLIVRNGRGENERLYDAMRAAFLSDPLHRIRFVYTPKHTSWLNQIEIWFSILVRKVLRRGSFVSTAELQQRIEGFIAYFNETMARAFKWTYKGRPLQA